MGSRGILAPVALAAALTAGGARAEPTAADRETARQLMADGRALRDKNDLEGALQRFEAADEIMHVPPTGLEVARTQVSLGLLVEARDTIARIRLEPARANDPVQFKEARTKANQLDASLDGRVPRLTVVVHGAPSGQPLSMSIDGVPVPAAVVGLPRTVDPGHHVVVVKAEGAEGQQGADVREGETKSLDVSLVSTGSRSRPPSPHGQTSDAPVDGTSPAPPERGRHQAETPAVLETSHTPDALTYTGGALAAAGLVVGAVTGAMSWSQTSSLSSACPAHVCPPASYSSYDSANGLATIATVSFGVAGVGTCLAVISLVVGHQERSQPASPSPSAQLRVSPWIGAGAAGLRGSF
jgi:hypothetical protein